jgi:hypothetical protein
VFTSGVWRHVVSRKVSKWAISSIEHAQPVPGTARHAAIANAARPGARAIRRTVIALISTYTPSD